MLFFLATETHELPLSTSLKILYFLVIDFEINFRLWATCNFLPTSFDQSTLTVKRLYNLFENVFVIFSMQCL